jgi:DNA polymerase-1
MRAFGKRVAMNAPIQGTAADIMKLAMIRVYNRLKREEPLARIVMQVHDELIVEAHKDCAERASEILKNEMENVAALSVPITVELKMADNWYECKD